MKPIPSMYWRPIATATHVKEGYHMVLLWVPGPLDMVSAVVGRWDDDRFAKRPRPFWRYGTSILDARRDQPTHWMPMPTTPHTPSEEADHA